MAPRFLPVLAALGVLALIGGAAEASTITQDTRYYSGGFPTSTAAAYLSTFDALASGGSGYGVTSVTSYDGLRNQKGTYGSVATEYTVDFGVTAAQAGLWTLSFGADAGFGVVAILDGRGIGSNFGNVASSNAIGVSNLAVAAGNHVLQVVQFEDCCDGGYSNGTFQFGTNPTAFFSTADGLNRVPPTDVPEPASFFLMAVAILGIGLARAKRA